ncbi:DnaB-like helicase C-terminal domain-containing protein [Bacillus sp. 7894-2]|uniref:DnaB-like helicase C-terminal domain-containing protein n=1 Tax=Bacillus sp. 7894-2 TaxID=2021695 RepID=UPI000BA4FB2E|nr:DnaB-like helicase C-terminal domain-containing protein [Bacillus sp. 7894-2]PAE24019.1 DNA helicase [Bacillus sp. 7894-2]
MPAYGEQFLSRLLDDGSTMAVREFNVDRTDFPTDLERQVYDFIMEYSKSNRHKTPDYRTVVEKYPDFYYRENVTDSYRYMVQELKSFSAKKGIIDIIEGQPDAKGKSKKPTLEDVINEKDGNVAIDYLISELEQVKMRTSVRGQSGIDVKKDAEKIIEEYKSRKSGESFKVWNSVLPTINEASGGYVSSNVYVIYGKSGRGKSAFSLREALYLAEQGANVLIWSMEMGWYEVIVRLFTMYSQSVGDVATAEINGVNMDVGFNSRDMRMGQLSEAFEEKLFDFIRSLNDTLAGNIIVKGVDDEDFDDRSLRALESDIIQNEADVVLLDPFYYLDYEVNTSKTKGGDAAKTSELLRKLAGRTGITVLTITQADETEETEDDAGNRELRLPKRKEVSKTKQLLQDAALLIAVDTNYMEGRGLVGLNKGRDGGEGVVAEIMYLPQYGIIKELEIDEREAMDLAEQIEGAF